MASFDPAAATAAYLATVSPAAQARATAYTHGGHWLLLWGWLVSVTAAWLIAKSGLLAHVQARLTRTKPRPVLVSLSLSLIFVLFDDLLELPWSAYAQWWREKGYGLTSQSWQGWLSEQAISAVVSAIMAAIFLSALYGLMRWAARWWWLWAGGLAAGFIIVAVAIAPTYIEPLFNHYTPAPVGPMRDAVVALAHKADVPADKIYIYDGSRQSNRYTANVSGLFGTARIAMSDVMFKKGADIAEVRAVVGHEMGHYKQGPLWIALPFGLMAIAAFGLTQLMFPWVANLFGVRAGVIADPTGLPAIMAILATLSLAATPLTNAVSRWAESDADSFSLRVADEPDGQAQALIKSVDYRAPSPSALEEFIFYDHPSVQNRILKAMKWKAEHPAKDAVQADKPAS